MLSTNIVDEATRIAIRSRLDSNIFVAAGAGTGKTTSLVSRILALIESGVGIDRILRVQCIMRFGQGGDMGANEAIASRRIRGHG